MPPHQRKKVHSGKFIMTILGAHLTRVIPAWVNGVEVVCNTQHQVSEVIRYADLADLKWESPQESLTVTIHF